jgi:hypothetical protein
MGKRILAIAISALALTGITTGADSTPKMGKREVKALIGSAKTAADHQKLATYFRQEAARLRAKQQEHEEEAAEYFKNPSNHPVPKYPTLGQHCRDLAANYKMAAEKVLTLAELHESLAKEAKSDVMANYIRGSRHPGSAGLQDSV